MRHSAAVCVSVNAVSHGAGSNEQNPNLVSGLFISSTDYVEQSPNLVSGLFISSTYQPDPKHHHHRVKHGYDTPLS